MKIKDLNKTRYNQIWQHTDIQKPQIWSTWKVVKEIIGKRNLEIGPGNFPAIPIKNGYFLDVSQTAVTNLKKTGAKAFLGNVEKIDFPDDFFDSAVAIDVLEHVEDDQKAFSEIVRVLKPRGFFLFSVPLGREKFGEIDRIAGHKRRYEIEELLGLIFQNGFQLVKWRAPSLKYFWVKLLSWAKFPFYQKLLTKTYQSKKSFEFFGLPKFVVNFLIRLAAFVDRLSAPSWQDDLKALRNFKGLEVMILCQKENK